MPVTADVEIAVQAVGSPRRAATPMALVLILLGLAVGALSLLIGAAPFIVEPVDAADPIDCGGSWNRAAGLHDACYTTFDIWASAARVGVAGAVVLAGLGFLLLLRHRATQTG